MCVCVYVVAAVMEREGPKRKMEGGREGEKAEAGKREGEREGEGGRERERNKEGQEGGREREIMINKIIDQSRLTVSLFIYRS